MVFSSILFTFYFLPLFYLCYYVAGKRYKNAIILAGSILFYAWGAPRFVFVLLGTTALDFYVVHRMDVATSHRSRRALLTLSLCINVGLLVYFKYSNFFIDNINVLLKAFGAGHIPWLKVIMPIGISFYTFETLTYVFDVYRRIHKPLRNFLDYQLYVIFFPKLIAGPIVRYHDFADQIYDHTTHESVDNKLLGLNRFFIGLGKKVLIANVLAAAADHIFKIPTTQISTVDAWLGALSYTFQIYFDFSGYSDMAIGLALMMGFRISENFNNPYTAMSVTDFWRRWHISLGNWMRTYLYIPLGGNRVASKKRLYLNLWLVFLASGLWHGAAWGFIIWGAYHGLFLVLERLFLQRWLTKLGKGAFIYTFLVVLVGWVFFRAEHLHASLAYLHNMFTWRPGNCMWQPTPEYWTMLGLAMFFSFFALPDAGARLQNKIFFSEYTSRMHAVVTVMGLVLCILSAARITVSTFNPFIYFRF